MGGLVAGALRGMDVATAARRYALLAIGDGLVSQIPALLLAVSAGIAVTRVAAEEEGDSLGGEIGRQLVAEPRALAAVAALLAALALAPGLPAAPFLVLSASAAAGARGSSARARAAPPVTRPVRPLPTRRTPRRSGPPRRSCCSSAPTSSRRPASKRHASSTWDCGRSATGCGPSSECKRHAIAVHGGGAPDGWALLVDEVPCASGRAPPGEALSLAAPDDLRSPGSTASRSAIRSPGGGRPASPAPTPRARRRSVRCAALSSASSPSAPGRSARSAHLLVGIQEAQVLLDGLEPAAPALVREAERQLPPVLLADVLRRLVEEGVSVRPLRTILEALLEAGGAARGAPALAEAARRALRRHIGHRCAGAGPLDALLLDPALEGALRDALAGEALALAPDVAARLLEGLEREVRDHGAPPVVLASGDVRRALRGLVAPRFPRVSVLAYDDLPPELPVRPVGRLALAA